MTLVESSVPPSPTSSTTMSHCLRAKYSIPSAVMISNSVGTSAMASAAGCTRSTSCTSSSSGICCPSTWMRSLKRLMKGEVNRPTR